ncbi:FtsX-like permease family protein [Mycobacterium sp. 1274761.0]|uniref:ABC transporter permease n=1 Tax=Mycobacterium sp. 1274761.0 TaxID=1834077 RepID=UPI0007FF248B|nr:FtsX-like permease family protein [Mycobacterium sp. 1274761.0]OBK74350.1 hypothetical protein A5651_11235 [Mycobacterium sp. 1274761.0]
MVLSHKLCRDLWRQRWQFVAAAVVTAIGVAVYVAGTDAYANLKQSIDSAYANHLLPDVVITGPGAFGLRTHAKRLPGEPVLDFRQQGDVGIRIHSHTVYGRAVSLPPQAQPTVSTLALRSGELPRRGAVLMEEHFSRHYQLEPGDTVELRGPHGWQTVSVSGSATSTEYLRPARSEQEIMSSPEDFGVVFVTAPDFLQVVNQPADQLLLYARDRDAAPQLLDAAEELAHARGLAVMSRDEQPSYRRLHDDVDSVGTFAKLLPWVFLAAAMVGTYALLSRLVVAQRAVVGTLLANGLSGPKVRAHYVGYGVAVGLLGATAGLIGGYFLGGWFTIQYVTALGMQPGVTSLHPTSLVTGAAAGMSAAALAAWAPAHAASRISPAEAMRISPPAAKGGLSVLEALLPPLRQLPARWRMVLRSVTRNRRRTALTVTGVVISVCLLMVFAGLRDTINRFFDRQYGGIELQDAQVITTAGSADQVATMLRADRRITDAELFTRTDITVEAGNNRAETLLIALPLSTHMHRFISQGSTRNLPSEGVLMGQGLAKKLGVTVGDRVGITYSHSNIRTEQPVAGFVDEPTSPVVYIAAAAARAAPSGVMVKLAPGTPPDQMSQTVTALPGVAAYVSTAAVKKTVRDAFSLYNAMVALLQVFAAVMAAALLYNTMSANVRERTVELGTLQAAGIGSGLLGRWLAVENMLLVAVGLPLGLLAGRLLADGILATYQTEYRWHIDMDTETPFIVAAAILGTAFLAQIPAFRIIGRIDVAKVVRERSL